MIMLVSGVVLIVVFVLTLVFGIVRIVNLPSQQVKAKTPGPKITLDDVSLDQDRSTSDYNVTDFYTIAEDVTKLIIELIFILFAILATFILYRYVKGKYASVPTAEPKAT